MRIPRSFALVLALPFLAASFALAPRAGAPPAPRDGGEEALAAAELALESAPEDPAALARAAKCAKEAGDSDKALWYARLGLEAAGDAKENRDAARELGALLTGIAAPDVPAQQLLDGYAKNLFQLAQLCERAKFYANAVDLLATCDGTPFADDAQQRLDKIFENKKAVEALLDSDVEVPAKPVTKKKPEWIAKEDAKHQDWASAYEVESKFYTVITDMGYEIAQSVSLAMGQMNAFYRKVFGYKERGGSMRSCEIKIYKSRGEFDTFENKPDPGVKGFFVPGDNRVATYDPRTDGFTLPDLWSTLFHESSHQFTHAYTTNLTPAWLNEGTASYFEGAILLPSGQVRTNQIPVRRLRNLVILLDQGSPTLKDVVSYFQPGSYDGSYYPFGWGLVYFLRNYEDEKSERVYLPVYESFWAAFKTAEKHEPFDRFVDYFVKKAAQPGIDGFEAFEKRWSDWIRDLHRIYFGPPERSDDLVERARKQLKNGKPTYAVESYRWALEKRFDDYRAMYEQAQVLEDLGEKDGALYGYRRVFEAARARGASEGGMPGFGERTAEQVRADCLGHIEKIDRNVHKAMLESDSALIAGVQEAAKAYQAAGFPRNALQVLATARAIVGGSAELAALSESIGKESGIDIRRWRRLPVQKGLELWEVGDDWSEKDGAVLVRTDGLDLATCREDLPDTYRYEATIQPADQGKFPVFGIVFGSNNATGAQLFAMLPKVDKVGLVHFEEGEPKITDSFSIPHGTSLDGLRLGVEVGENWVELFVGDKKVGRVEMPPNELRGHVGVMAQDVKATFLDLRVLY